MDNEKIKDILLDVADTKLEFSVVQSEFGGYPKTPAPSVSKGALSQRAETAKMPQSQSAAISEPASQLFHVGDTVQHKKFGLGVVTEVKFVNADYQVRVNFAKVGEKLLFAKLAGLKKV